MLEAGLQFDRSLKLVLDAFAKLPGSLRPIQFSHEERVENDADRIEDVKRFAGFVEESRSGFFLLGPSVTYSVRIAAGRPLVCDCFMDVKPEGARQFLEHMSQAGPTFGFACAPGEREQRNRITIQQGPNTIETWVGRDTDKYVPGFYWLTLLPEALARRHRVPLSAVNEVAREHVELDGGQHLFRFYEQPEDWQVTSNVRQLCASLPGVFDVERVRPQLAAAKDFLQMQSMLRAWR